MNELVYAAVWAGALAAAYCYRLVQEIHYEPMTPGRYCDRMFEARDWIRPRVVHTGCCEGARWQLHLAGPDNTRDQARLAGLAVNPAATADVLLAVAQRGGRLPRLVLAQRVYQDTTFCDEYPDVAAALATAAAETADPHLLERIVFNADFAPEAAAALAGSPDHRVRASVPFMDVTPELLAALADDPHPEVRRSVMCLSNLGFDLLTKLARDPDPELREALGDFYGGLPAEIVDILVQDPVAAVRAAVVEHADAAVAEELAVDADPEVRATAARQGKLSDDTMLALADDPEQRVRAALAWSEQASVPVLRILAADPDPEVRRAVALHPATPADVLADLAAAPEDAVAITAVTAIGGETRRPLPSLEQLEARAERLSVDQLRIYVGSEFWSGCNPGPRPWPVEEAEDARHALLARCAVSRFARLRALAASDRRLPLEIAAALAGDRDPVVRRWLARYCRYPEVLRTLADTPGQGVGDALAGNYHAPSDVVERLAVKPHRLAMHWNAPSTLLARLLDGADHATRRAVAGHRNTSPDVLADLARGDAERDVIRTACAHPDLPVTVMWELLAQPATVTT